jgi:transposase-like protein
VARYGQAFKDRVVARLLPPESASVHDVAREIGVGLETLERWRSDADRTVTSQLRLVAGAIRALSAYSLCALANSGRSAFSVTFHLRRSEC